MLTKKVRTKLGPTKIIFIDTCALIFREPFIESIYTIYTISNTSKEMTDAVKEKLKTLVEEYRRINSKPNSFRVLSIL